MVAGPMTGQDVCFDADEVQRQVQGNILRGYGNDFRCVRHVVLKVADPMEARAVLGRMVNGDRATPEVTSGERAPKSAGMKWCLNVGITYHGLRALGVPATSLATFAPEFVEGMVARAPRLGDYGESSPSHWVEEFRNPERVDLLVSIHGFDFADIEPIAKQVIAAADGKAFELVSVKPLDGEVLEPKPTTTAGGDGLEPVSVKVDGAAGDDATRIPRHVHFGYRDGIAQPRFEGIHDPALYAASQQFAPIGTVLLGHPTAVPHIRWPVPAPAPLGLNGSFNAFRMLRQDVDAFEGFLAETADRLGWSRELVAAKMCGRWRNGVPLSLAPTEDKANEMAAAATKLNDLNNFDYLDVDPDGASCPIGSHIRRSNPRRAHIVQRAANRSRLIIRRGVPYGKPFDPKVPDTVERGLLGNFMCASLAAQFEATHHDWLNLGLQDPRITGTNDPLVGNNDAVSSQFSCTDPSGKEVVIRGLPRFVQTRGGAYCFLPSLPALQWIASAGWNAT